MNKSFRKKNIQKKQNASFLNDLQTINEQQELIRPTTTSTYPPYQFNDSDLRPSVNQPSHLIPKNLEIRPTTWKIQNNQLETFPSNFHLERSCRFVHDSDACTVAARICDCLRSRSIHATFDDKKAQAKCKTFDFVSFHINLFAGKDNCVIVEVQKRKGCAITFAREYKAILEAAGGEYLNECQEISECDNFSPDEMQSLQETCLPLDTEDFIEIDFQHTDTLIRSNRLDDMILGFNSLCCLTDPRKSSNQVASRISKKLINSPKKIQSYITSIAIHEDNYLYSDLERDRDIVVQMYSFAFSILSNIFSVASKDNFLRESINSQEQWFINYLLPLLIAGLKCAKDGPYQAYLAARCLSFIVLNSFAARDRVLEEQDALLDAENIGFISYAHLEIELKSLISFLQTCSSVNQKI